MALDVSRRILGDIDGGSNFAQYNFAVANGAAVAPGDFVYFTSGRITAATIAGARPIGMVTGTLSNGLPQSSPGTITGNSAGTNTADVVIDPWMKYLLQNDNLVTTFAATHVGTYFDLIGASGAQLVDTSTTSATLGTLLCLEYNPQIDPVKSDLTYGIFLMVNSALLPYVAG